MGKVFGPIGGGVRTTDSSRTKMQWLVDDELADGAGQSVARMTLKPGAVSEAHRHPNCSEVIHLISGRIEQVVGDESFVLNPGDTAFIPAGHRHQSRNLQDENAEMLISYSAGRRVYEMAEDQNG